MGEPDPLFIVNPIAGGGRARRRIAPLRDALQRAGFAPDVVITERSWHAYALARKAIDEGRETIVACGGDGTSHEVANAIFDARAAHVRLAMMPLGTGMDVAKCLGVGKPKLAMRALLDGEDRLIDAGRIECFDAAGQPIVRHFLLEASAGWIPEIAHSVPLWLKRMGETAPYIAVTIVKALGRMNREFEVLIDDQPFDGRYNSISVHNMPVWAGGLEVAPGADPADGSLDVIRWGALGRSKLLQVLQGQRQGGKHLEIPGIDHHPARAVFLDALPGRQLDLDGEAGAFLPARIEVIPRALRVVAPSGSAP